MVNHNRRRGDPEESEAHVHRRATDENAFLQLHSRVEDHERRLDGHDKLIDAFSASIDALNANMGRVADVLEALANLKGFWATLKLLSGASKVILTLVAFAAVLWGGFKFIVWLAGIPA